MSAIARWTYTNTARVRPTLGVDMETGAASFGAEYDIACTWAAESKRETDAQGDEFVSRHVVYTEDPRPQYLDLVLLAGATEWETVRAVTEWDMSPFGDTPDRRLIT